jgi:hypothetical protein
MNSEKINIRVSYQAILPSLIELVSNPHVKPEEKEKAEKELQNMAIVADIAETITTQGVIDLLCAAERFIAGFEDDELQEEPVDDLLNSIREVIAGKSNMKADEQKGALRKLHIEDIKFHGKRIEPTGITLTDEDAVIILNNINKKYNNPEHLTWEIMEQEILYFIQVN